MPSGSSPWSSGSAPSPPRRVIRRPRPVISLGRRRLYGERTESPACQRRPPPIRSFSRHRFAAPQRARIGKPALRQPGRECQRPRRAHDTDGRALPRGAIRPLKAAGAAWLPLRTRVQPPVDAAAPPALIVCQPSRTTPPSEEGGAPLRAVRPQQRDQRRRGRRQPPRRGGSPPRRSRAG
jgi:hypothetical protein